MAQGHNRTSPRAWRPARTPVQGLRAKLGTVECTVANLSSTGAMLRSRIEVAVGREATLALELTPSSITANVRVVRCEAIDVGMPGEAVWRRRDYALGVMFLDRSRELTAAIKSVTKDTGGIEDTEPRVLIVGEDNDVSRALETAMQDAHYHPRVLGHPSYAVATARRIGAKAIVINLDLDPELSARGLFDSLRNDPATAAIPIIICARQEWLVRWRASYAMDKLVTLLSVPCPPKDLIEKLDTILG